MGQELVCAVRLAGRRAEGKALLETDELLFRGEPRLRIPFSEIRALEAANGELAVTFPGGTAVFELGVRAAAVDDGWALVAGRRAGCTWLLRTESPGSTR